MSAWALKPRLRVVCLASQQGGGWVPLRWLRRVLTEWRVVVLQGQEQWRGEDVKRIRVGRQQAGAEESARRMAKVTSVMGRGLIESQGADPRSGRHRLY